MFKNLKKKIYDQRGLTLIELLAVIVILGIVAAIAVPSIMGIINKSKEDAKVAEAIQIISAAKMQHATNSTKVTWTHTDLDSSLDNVQDAFQTPETAPDYVVYYDSTNGYSIKDHDAATVSKSPAWVPVASGTAAGAITEKELLKYSK